MQLFSFSSLIWKMSSPNSASVSVQKMLSSFLNYSKKGYLALPPSWPLSQLESSHRAKHHLNSESYPWCIQTQCWRSCLWIWPQSKVMKMDWCVHLSKLYVSAKGSLPAQRNQFITKRKNKFYSFLWTSADRTISWARKFLREDWRLRLFCCITNWHKLNNLEKQTIIFHTVAEVWKLGSWMSQVKRFPSDC